MTSRLTCSCRCGSASGMGWICQPTKKILLFSSFGSAGSIAGIDNALGTCILGLNSIIAFLDFCGPSVDELVSRYTVQCTTQKQNKTPRVYKARQYTRCTCQMSSATSCSVRVPRGSYVNQEGVTEKACLRALSREMMED